MCVRVLPNIFTGVRAFVYSPLLRCQKLIRILERLMRRLLHTIVAGCLSYTLAALLVIVEDVRLVTLFTQELLTAARSIVYSGCNRRATLSVLKTCSLLHFAIVRLFVVFVAGLAFVTLIGAAWVNANVLATGEQLTPLLVRQQMDQRLMEVAPRLDDIDDVGLSFQLLSGFLNAALCARLPAAFASINELGRQQISHILNPVCQPCRTDRLRLTTVSALDREDLSCHVRVEMLVVPDAQEDGDGCEEDRLNAADIGKDVDESVAGTRQNLKVQVHLNADVHLHVQVLFV